MLPLYAPLLENFGTKPDHTNRKAEYQTLNEPRTWVPMAEQPEQKCQRWNYY